ncbi:hypothetical protein HJFPF1_06245 [Paramyrothecium foliicola]|nr:hypothetical protein HJFPF1_06245 [Paramyrothecium foliicola]
MAIYSAVPPPPEHQTPSSLPPAQAPATPGTVSSGIDIDAWTISALQSLSVSPVARGTGTPLAIPIDEPPSPIAFTAAAASRQSQQQPAVQFIKSDPPVLETTPPRRPLSRRDSQKRRDALLKGNEGSRQRRRWENGRRLPVRETDRLMHVPNAQPPQPIDWEVQPTHRIQRVRYQVAQYWDHGVRQRIEDRTSKLQAARKTQQLKTGCATGLGVGEVPRDLRESAKRSPIVKSWVKVLEDPIRQYLVNQQSPHEDEDSDSAADEFDSEDEEIVFVGRNGAMRDLQEKSKRWKPARREVSDQTVDSGMVFDSFGNDEGAAFRRWLTHSISDYYGLESKSVTMSNPSRRVVYVGLKTARRQMNIDLSHLPRPLWQLC